MRMIWLACALCGLVAGCGGGGGGGNSRVDAGGSGFDAGTPPEVDAGTPPEVDAGPPEVDAGPLPEVDAGPPPEVDAGPPPEVDAGAGMTDAGTGMADAGPVGRACEVSSDCAVSLGRYCDLGGGTCGGSGTCTVRPMACTREFAPVCGCDGNTYSNACMASMAGVSVAASGECATTCPVRYPTGCCFTDAHCGRGQVCVNEFCAGGLAGTCEPLATAPGRCWEDSDCGRGQVCRGERVCACGARCILPDEPGTCGL